MSANSSYVPKTLKRKTIHTWKPSTSIGTSQTNTTSGFYPTEKSASRHHWNSMIPMTAVFRFGGIKQIRDWLESELQQYARNNYSDSDEAYRQAQVHKVQSQMLEPDSGGALVDYQTRCMVSPKVGVLSLSLGSLQPLMWAHYSDSHKGFAVGFDQPKLLEAARSISGAESAAVNKSPTRGLEIRPVQVRYPRVMPELVPAQGNEVELMRAVVTTKSEAWKYENEVRYLLMNFDENLRPTRLTDEERVIKLPIEVIREVVLGANVSHSNIERVVNLLSDGRPRVNLWRASSRYGMFGLDREKIDY